MSLIAAHELARRIGNPELRIADVRWWLADPAKGRRDYGGGHVPGAVFVDVERELVAREGPGRHPLPDPRAFVRRMAELGFGDEHEIVAYDDAGGSIAARLWWMLDDLGHPRVRVLDGGLAAWTTADGTLTRTVPAYPPARLTLRDRWTSIIERDDLAGRLGSVSLLDARAPERYRGETEPIDSVAGHIPTAINAPYAGNLDPDGRFLPPASLLMRFAGLLGPAATHADAAPNEGGRAGRPVVTSCGSGITACHHALAMRVAGLPGPLLYPGSYSDWSRSGLPVATGDEPGALDRPDSGSGEQPIA